MDITIEGNVNSFTAKAVKAGESKQLTGKLCIAEPQLELLSELCELQPQALKAMAAAEDAGAKVELLCMGEGMSLLMKPITGETEVTSSHATLKKIVYDATKADPVAILHYSEPALRALVLFYYDHIGFNIEMTISKTQPDLEL